MQDKILKKIYDTDCDMYTTSRIKFGICMATYQRPNGKTPQHLLSSFHCILNQTASNWHLYLVGDKYENNEEFEMIINTFPKDKISYINLPHAIERENVKNPHELWKIAGSNAFNVANTMALDDGCDYILHYDDDDLWHLKKIQILNYICAIYNNPCFLFHYSTHTGPAVIPREEIEVLGKNLLLPAPCNVIHSACCAHKRIMKEFKYEGFVPGKSSFECGDQNFLAYVKKYIETNKEEYSVFIPLFLSRHDAEHFSQ